MPDIPTVNEKLLQRYIRHSVYLEQLKKSEARYISRFLGKKVFPSLSEKLIEELSKVKNLETLSSIRKIPIRRLTRMMLAVRKTAQAGAVKAEKMLIKRLVNISRFEADWNADIIKKTVPFDLDMTMPSNEVLKNLAVVRPFDGHKLSTWMKGYSKTIQISMVKQIRVGIATGESLPAIGARINRALNWKGKQAEFIARTAVSNVVHQAREEVFKKNKDIVRKVQWVSTLDDRTSMECIHLDGRMYNVGDGPRPPIHFNCRSTVIPITPSWQEFGVVDPPAATRASMNGAVPAKMTYKQWLKAQGKTAKGRAIQDKVLGKKRAELYRSGRVKIDKFVGKDLKPLTLKQLAKREGLDLAPAPAPPLQVRAISIKNNGIDLTAADFKRIENYSWENYSGNIVRAQLGKPLRNWWNYPTKKVALIEAQKMEATIAKLDGFTGTTHRGLRFNTAKQRQTFLSKFKEGSVWKGGSFQSSTKSLTVAKDFMKEEAKFYASKNSVLMHIDGVSGRDLTNRMQEVLFKAGTPFKVTKIKGNEIWLQEITKQAQLRPAPPSTITKVGATFTKTTSKEFQDIVSKQIDAYPEKVKVALNKGKISFNVGTKITEMYPELKGVKCRGWAKGTTWDNVNGIFKGNTKQITINEYYKPTGHREFIKNPKVRAFLNHETGHGFSNSGKISYHFSKEFSIEYAKDVVKLSTKDKNNLRYFLQIKNKAGQSETFAEVFADIMGEATEPNISKFFPSCKKYIEGLLK